MQEILDKIEENRECLVKVICSDTVLEAKKMIIKPVLLKEVVYQVEKYVNKQVFHENLKFDELSKLPFSKYNQVVVETAGVTYQFIKKGNKYACKKTANNFTCKVESHNRDKNYILSSGENIPAFVDLGIFTKENKIVNSMYDKYKQINRFIEIIDDVVKDYKDKEITILDFGCGKSYLTFIMYYYFTIKKNIKATIIDYDLKKDVVDNCNKLACKYGYDNLKFIVADVSKDALFKGKIDMVVSLHACDTATDYALNYAINNKVKYIFSVPCCQHEVNKTITKGGDFDILLKDGLIKERFSALLTDAIRVEKLRSLGYSVDVIEFVDLSHTPKNLLIRAIKNSKVRPMKYADELKEKYKFSRTLLDL